jgi:O-antigen ligase
MSGTRSSGVALILTTILILYIERKKYLNFKNGFIVIFISIIFFYYIYSKDIKFRIFDIINDNSTISSRLINYQISFESINPFAEDWSKFIFGWGWNNFYLAWDKYYIDKIKLYDPLPFDKAHNFYIDLLVTSGIFGFCIYLIIIKEIYKSIFLIADNQLKIGLLFIFTCHFIDLSFSFNSISNYISIQIIHIDF